MPQLQPESALLASPPGERVGIKLLDAAVPATAVGVDQIARAFSATNPACTLKISAAAPAAISGVLFVGQQFNGPWQAVGVFSAAARPNALGLDSGAPSHCSGQFWKFIVTSSSGDQNAVADFWLETDHA